MLTSTADLSNSTINTPTSGFEVEANASINRVLTTISGSLSLLGTSLIIGTYIAWKDFRSTSRIILVYVSIADFIVAGSNLVGVWHRHTETGRDVLCEAQSFVTATASLWSFFWTTFLAAFMYMTVAKKQRNKAVIMLKVFHGFGWGIPIIIVGTALGLQKLGNDKDFYTSGWCWINSDLNDEDKHLWMLLTGKAWEIAAYVICSTFYLLLRCHIHKEVHSHQKEFPDQKSKETLLKAEKRLTLVPVIFVMVRIWGTSRFILYMSNVSLDIRDAHNWWEHALLYLQGIGDNIQGFANFLLFCLFTEKFQTHLRLAAHNLLRLLCKEQESGDSMSVTESTVVTHSQETLVNDRSRLFKSS